MSIADPRLNRHSPSLARFDRRFGRSILVLAMAGFALSACALGPDFRTPPAPKVTAYTAKPVTIKTAAAGGPAGAKQHFKLGAEISGDWWHIFHATDLNSTIKLAIADNLTLAEARANLGQAEAEVAVARGAYFPQINGSAGASRQDFSYLQIGQNAAGPVYSLYSTGANVSYPLDIFGLARRTVEAQTALASVKQAELAAAYLTLTGNVVSEAINIAGLRAQIAAVDELIEVDKKNLALVKAQVAAGAVAVSGPQLLSAESQLAHDRTLSPPLYQELSVARHALALLLGRAPAQWSPPAFDFADFTLPEKLPVSLPSVLVRRRPDILAAEAGLHAASARIGVATAELYPQITIGAAGSFNSLTAAKLFTPPGRLWSLGASLTLPIFHGGALEAQKRAAIAAYRGAAAAYKQTVLQAFTQVADVLRALSHDAELLQAEVHALNTAKKELEYSRTSLTAGAFSTLQLLDATRQYQQAKLGYVRAVAQRYQDTARLFVAMGGGWWQPESPFHAAAVPESGYREIEWKTTK